jgi:hypothetical protein
MSKKITKESALNLTKKINQNKTLNRNGNKYLRVKFIDTHILSVTY